MSSTRREVQVIIIIVRFICFSISCPSGMLVVSLSYNQVTQYVCYYTPISLFLYH